MWVYTCRLHLVGSSDFSEIFSAFLRMLYIFFSSPPDRGAVEQATNVSRNYSRKQKHEECFSSRISRVVGRRARAKKKSENAFAEHSQARLSAIRFVPSFSLGNRYENHNGIYRTYTKSKMRALFLFRDEDCDWWWSPTSSSSPTFSEFHQSPSDFIRVSIADHLNTSSRFKNVITNTLGAASASFTMWLWPCVGGWLEKKTRSYFSSRATQARREKNALFAFTQNIFPVLFSRLEKLCETRFKIASFIFWFRFCCGDFFTRLSLRELNEKKKRNKLLSNIVELRRWKIVKIVSTCEP